MKIIRNILGFVLTIIFMPIVFFFVAFPAMFLVGAWTIDLDKGAGACEKILEYFAFIINKIKGN